MPIDFVLREDVFNACFLAYSRHDLLPLVFDRPVVRELPHDIFKCDTVEGRSEKVSSMNLYVVRIEVMRNWRWGGDAQALVGVTLAEYVCQFDDIALEV